MINQWDLWFAEFPYEEGNGSKDRPVIVLNVEPLEVLSIKVTKTSARDEFDIPIVRWKEAGLKSESVARVSKAIELSYDKFRRKIGNVHMDDRQVIMSQYMKYISENQ